ESKNDAVPRSKRDSSEDGLGVGNWSFFGYVELAIGTYPLSPMTGTPIARGGLYLLFFLSGAAGLGYQMVWSKMFAAGLGHEMPAVLAVVCAFMGGMAIGAWTLDGVVARSRRPGYW